MAGGTLVFQSTTDRVMPVGTEVASEDFPVPVIEERTQNRKAFNPVLVRERGWKVEVTDDRLWAPWMRVEIGTQ